MTKMKSQRCSADVQGKDEGERRDARELPPSRKALKSSLTIWSSRPKIWRMSCPIAARVARQERLGQERRKEREEDALMSREPERNVMARPVAPARAVRPMLFLDSVSADPKGKGQRK